MGEIIVGAHFYDPPRNTYHEMFRNVSTDGCGVNWLKVVYERSYGPLSRSGILSKMSYDINAVLLHEMQRNGLPYTEFVRGKADNVIGTPYIHPILPDLSDDDKRIVIGAGVVRYQKDFGRNPTIFWAPESAMDQATARVALECGYEAFVCAPWQLQTADGSWADNQPMRINLPGGRSIIAIPYDREISSQIAFGDKSNADRFRDTHIRGKAARNNLLISWDDGETFGHWAEFADLFLAYLLTRSLPDIGVAPTPINQINFKRMSLPQARLVERTAWSCRCGNLARWHQGCGCANGADTRWKFPYYDSFNWLNQQVTSIVANELGKNYVRELVANFETAFVNPGGRYTNPKQSLIAARVDALTARTSCGTFHMDPHTAGRINIIFGLEALQHLRDAGIRHVEVLEGQFMDRLRTIIDPTNRSRNLAQVTEEMLGLPRKTSQQPERISLF